MGKSADIWHGSRVAECPVFKLTRERDLGV
jgi:hypothetical protein